MTNKPNNKHNYPLMQFVAITNSASFSKYLSSEYDQPVISFSNFSQMRPNITEIQDQVTAVFIDTSTPLNFESLAYVMSLSKPVFFRNSSKTWQISLKHFSN